VNARIYKPSKTAMQAGRANTRDWVLDYAPADRRTHDPLMGWIGSSDTKRQVRLRFPSREAAEAFAARNGIVAAVEAPRERRLKLKSYADNFRYQAPSV